MLGKFLSVVVTIAAVQRPQSDTRRELTQYPEFPGRRR
jgi:hypothetical protein